MVDNPTARDIMVAQTKGLRSRPHKPGLDEMGIALGHEVKPARSDAKARSASLQISPRSKLGRPGMHGGFKSNRKR